MNCTRPPSSLRRTTSHCDDGRSSAEDFALLLHPVREHYIVYEPLGARLIAVVAVIRQGRDIAAILQKWAMPIRRELLEIRARIARGEITVRTRTPAVKSRRKK